MKKAALSFFFCLCAALLLGSASLYTISGGDAATEPPGTWLAIALIVLVLAVALTWLASWLFQRPLGAVHRTLDAMVAGRLQPLETDGATDAGSSAALLQQCHFMQERVRALLRQRSRLMRGLSDELRAPLARLQALVSVVEKQGGDRPEIVVQLQEELDTLHDLVADILVYSQLERQHSVRHQDTSLRDLLQTLVDDSGDNAAASNLQLQLQPGPDTILSIDYALVHTALENLIEFALQHAAPGTAVVIRVTEEEQRLRIIVRATAGSIEQRDMRHLFEPFYRPTPRHNGSGLGPAVASRIFALHDGKLVARRIDDGEFALEAELPLTP